ncbi:unnamed protein product [Schistosoma curassoni]|uniref:JmjC domain-containing protein n=1 Tax=Schistosoma curassoni TaxID=6186 RepID=A0A183KJQ6_9TREM|nr:unnamed protein product [Schistosoma curassoni]
MDHSNRSSNSVNHQTKKERSVHGKPEAKNNLKRSHSISESEPGTIKDERPHLSNELKRTKYSVNAEIRRPGSSHLGTNISNRPVAHDCRYDPLRKTKLNHLPPRTFTTDDMEISPNSSPLSDGSSTKFPPNRQFSPQKSNMSFCSPEKSTLYQLVDAIRASIGDLLEQPPKSLSCASEKPINGSVYESCKASVPSENSLMTTNQLSPNIISKRYKQSDVHLDGRICSPTVLNSRQLTKMDSPAAYPSSVNVESRNCSVNKGSSYDHGQGYTTGSKVDPPYPPTCSIYVIFYRLALFSQILYSMGDPRRTVSSSHSPAYPNPVTSQGENHRFPSNATHPVCCSVSHQNSPAVICSPHNPNNTTTSVSSASHQTCVSLSHYDLSSRQVDKIIEILAEQAHCQSTTEEHNFNRNVSLSSSRLPENLKGSTSPGHATRAPISQTLQTNHSLNRDSVNPNTRSQHTQLNDLVQVLKAALHHHTSNHMSGDPATSVQSNNRLNTCPDSDLPVNKKGQFR